MDRVILHCDCNNYFASVESVDRPELSLVPMAVCGDPQSRRGIILSKNELAKKQGIITAETVFSALRKCQELVLIPPHHGKYQLYCKKINAIYEEYTDQVEAVSIDESYLDVTGSQHLFGGGPEIADALRKRIKEEIGVTISAGVSFNKVFAKLGSDYKKPDATTVISRDNYKELLWPLPVGDMLFVGSSAAGKLMKQGIMTIGDIAEAGCAYMLRLLGKMGETVWAGAVGLDESPVKRIGESDPVKSVSNSATFYRDLITAKDIQAALLMLCDSVGTRLRRQGYYCTTLQVQIKDPLLHVISRQRKLDIPVNTTRALVNEALKIVKSAWEIGSPIRLLSVCAEGLTEENTAQLSLFSDTGQQDKNARLDTAMDGIRARFGQESLQFGSVLQTDLKGKDKKKK